MIVATMLQDIIAFLLWKLRKRVTIAVVVKPRKVNECAAELVYRLCPALEVLSKIDHFFICYLGPRSFL